VDTVRNEYDFQRGATAPRGLVLALKDPRGHGAQIEFDPHDLLPIKVTDAAGLDTTATYNYRVLQPSSVTDPNGTTTHILYTALGLPRLQFVESADRTQGGTRAKPELLHRYGFDNFMMRKSPIHVETERRIHHAKTPQATDDTVRSREFSDGFGRLVQSRVQAEDLVFGERGDDVGLPGQVGAAVAPAIAARVNDAVVVSGFQEYDQKGRVIRKYEPCFDAGFDYQPGRKPANAVFARMFYDPRGQVIRTVNPDGSEQRIIFGVPGSIAAPKLDDPAAFEPTPWESYVYDANDLSPLTHAASAAPSSHHFTPASTLLDGMGRSIAQIVRNGPSPAADWHITRSSFDVRGNLLAITDALNRSAFQHSHDLLNRPLKVDSIDAGLRTSVLDAIGNLVESRDSKGSLALRRYDNLNRPIELWARDNDVPASPFTIREKLTYAPNGAPKYSAGRLIEHHDEAGIVKVHGYDFKGNILETSRQVPKDSEMSVWLADWSSAQAAATASRLESKAYVTTTSYDALNRVIAITYPEDVSGRRALLTPHYNRGGALHSVKIRKSAVAAEETFVEHIAYNARSQRVLIAFGNGVMTRHAYNLQNFRLARLRTERFQKPDALQWFGLGPATGLNDELLQDYSYRYDLAGNIISIEERVKHCGVRNPDPDQLLRLFDYDPLYRLTKATGRCSKQTSPARPYDDQQVSGFHAPNHPSFSQTNGPDLTDGYTEDYQYDPAGNMLAMGHSQGGTPWVRRYDHAAASNRLSSITVGSEIFTCEQDLNGNLIRQALNHHHDWDHADRMIGYRNQNGSAASVQARYLYGADGMRVKKWVRRGPSAVGEESTTYIGGLFEHHRWSDSGATRENNHLHVMDNQSRVAMQRIGPANQEDAAPEVQYHLGDHLGSSSLVLGGATAGGAAFVNREEYSPYGETVFGSFGRKRYRFSGKERDDESGLSYFGARYLAPWMAKWMNCDPSGPVDSVNLLIYVKNNPMRFLDSMGKNAMPGDQEKVVQTVDPCLQYGCIKNDSRSDIDKLVDDFLEVNPTAYIRLLKVEALDQSVMSDPELIPYSDVPRGELQRLHNQYVSSVRSFFESQRVEERGDPVAEGGGQLSPKLPGTLVDGPSENADVEHVAPDQSSPSVQEQNSTALQRTKSTHGLASADPQTKSTGNTGFMSRIFGGAKSKVFAYLLSLMVPNPNSNAVIPIKPTEKFVKAAEEKRKRAEDAPRKQRVDPPSPPPPPKPNARVNSSRARVK
jgi:RHS repeat-associated protein